MTVDYAALAESNSRFTLAPVSVSRKVPAVKPYAYRHYSKHRKSPTSPAGGFDRCLADGRRR